MKRSAVPVFMAFIAGVCLSTASADGYAAAGVEAVADVTGLSAATVSPGVHVDAGFDKNLLLTPSLAAFAEGSARVRYDYAPQDADAAAASSGADIDVSAAADGSYRFGAWLTRVRVAGAAAVSVPWTVPYGAAAVETELMWGGMTVSAFVTPRLVIDISPTPEVRIEADAAATVLVGTSLIVEPMLGGSIRVDEATPDYQANFGPRLSVSWYPGPRFNMELAAGYGRYISGEYAPVVTGGAEYPIGTYHAADARLTAGVVLSRKADIGLSIPVFGQLAAYPATADGAVLEEREWVVSMKPRVELGIHLRSGVIALFDAEAFLRASNTPDLRAGEITVGAAVEIRF